MTTPFTLDDLAGRATIKIHPEASGLLGLSKDAAYRAAAAGQIPTIRLGRRIVVPVPKLLALLGAAPGEDA